MELVLAKTDPSLCVRHYWQAVAALAAGSAVAAGVARNLGLLLREMESGSVDGFCQYVIGMETLLFRWRPQGVK